MANLIRSAAVPCNGVLTAVRSAKPRRLAFLEDVGDGADASEKGLHRGVAPGLFARLLQPGARRVLAEVGVDILLGLAGLNAELLRQAEGRQTVECRS